MFTFGGESPAGMSVDRGGGQTTKWLYIRYIIYTKASHQTSFELCIGTVDLSIEYWGLSCRIAHSPPNAQMYTIMNLALFPSDPATYHPALGGHDGALRLMLKKTQVAGTFWTWPYIV